MAEAFIVEVVRTAGGKRNGALAGWHPGDMAGEVLSALAKRSGIDPAAVEDVVMGCVSQGGEQSFALGRTAVLASDLPDSVPAVTIDRQCGSSQQAVQFAAQAVMSGTQDVVIAAGVESMSRVPMFSPYKLYEKAGIGTKPWSEKVLKKYGVEEFSQFPGAQMMAEKFGFSREDLDAYALNSHKLAAKATEAGAFENEILPLEVEDPAGKRMHKIDEGVRFDATFEGIASLQPLVEGGMITAGNASQISDGASGVMVASERAIKEHNLKPLARIHSVFVSGGDPVIMLEEPIHATRRALERAGMSLDDIDVYEVNEAFASVPLAWLKEMKADPDKLNVNGGAIALGHPLGSSGTKLMTTLVNILHQRGARYGLQTMCEGGGMANVTIIERV